MHDFAVRRRSGYLIKLMLLFFLHQAIATIGVMVGAGLLVDLGLTLTRVLGGAVSRSDLHRILTGTPYFPVQIGLALLSGCVLSRWLRSRTTYWVWVVPTVVLCYFLIALPTPAASLARGSRLDHFFGWGCRPENFCFDQLGVTLPFYLGACYSIGA